MLSLVLASAAALAYGVADVLGGLVSRRASPNAVVCASYPASAVLVIASLWILPGRLSQEAWSMGLAGGAVGALGVVLLYQAMAAAPISLVAPCTAVCTALVPVVFGVLEGDRPSASRWAGVALAVIAVCLVTRRPRLVARSAVAVAMVNAKAVGLAAVAGASFGIYFVLLAQPASSTGAWPVVVARAAGASCILLVAWRKRSLLPVRGRNLVLAVNAGALDAAGNLLFLTATRHGNLASAGLVTALYPTVTVLLATLVLREPTHRAQRVGFALAGASVVLIAGR